MPGKENAGSLAIGEGNLFVGTDPEWQKQASHLVALNPKTGKSKWRVQRAGTASQIAVGKDTLYLAMKPYSISAFDYSTRRTKWTRALPKGKDTFALRGGLDAVAFANGFVLANCGNVSYCLNANDGNILWSEPKSYMFSERFVALDGIAWVSANEGSVARELSTGKVLWRKPAVNGSEFAGVFGRMFVGLGHGYINAIQPRTGAVIWSKLMGPVDTSGGRQFGAVLGDRLFVQGISRAAIFDKNGKELWSAPGEDALNVPTWSDGETLVTFDSERLIRYAHGEEAAIPSDSVARQALVRKMIAHYSDLDDTDKKRLAKLGDDAFEPLLALFLATCAAHDAMGSKGDSYPLYSKFHDIGEILTQVTTKKRAKDLMRALDSVKPNSSSKPLLLSLLGRVGDSDDVTPYFLREIDGSKTPGYELYESNTYVARSYIINSKDPRAVAFMLKQLKDPKADETLRYEAYVNLAGTGGDEGLKAVLAERNSRSLLRPLSERVLSGFLNAGEFGTRTKPLAQKKDAKGRTWGLLQSGALGSFGDLWLAEQVDGQWTNPIFAGVSTAGVSNWAKPKPPEPTIGGKTAKQLVDGAWFDVLVNNAAIRKDTSGGGLTDLCKKRLGLELSKTDTDGDGDPDSVDPWPNAARSELGESEKVLAAAFEARYHFDNGEGPGLFFAPQGMKPFEMVGRRGPMIWVSASQGDWSLPLQQCYEQGVAFIRFGESSRDATKPWEERVIGWNSDHSQATLSISTYFGGLNGTGYTVVVRKFGDNWVVVQMSMAYVS